MMQKQKSVLISVVIPAFNCEKYIKNTLESVLEQTYKNIEVLVIDDCSEDQTSFIVEEMSGKDPRIHLIVNENNQGVSNTRNRGIKEARGDYIALLDSDDVWTSDKIERQVNLALTTQAPIIFCSYGFIDENGKKIKRDFIVPKETDFKKMLSVSVISCSTALIKSDLLKNNLFNPKAYHEDYELWMKLLSLPVKAAGDTKVLAYYRQTDSSRNAKKGQAAIERWKIYRKILKMGRMRSLIAFTKYAVAGFSKYYVHYNIN